MKQNKLIAPEVPLGEMSDELQQYKILQLETQNKQHYEEIIQQFKEIKDYMYNKQDKIISSLERRIEKLETQQTEAQKEKQKKNSNRNKFYWLIIASVITQLCSWCFIFLFAYFGLK